MKKFAFNITVGAVSLLTMFGLVTQAGAVTVKQDVLHDVAETCRSIGISDNHPILQELSDMWWDEYNDVEILTTVIFNESKYGSDRLQELVGAVVWNRKNSDIFPDTIYDVVTQPGQYLKAYATPGSYYWNLARSEANQNEYLRCRAVAERVLNGEVDCPANVVWQANFKQGDGTYETIVFDSPYFHSVSYFGISKLIPIEEG